MQSKEPTIAEMNEIIGIFMGGKWEIKNIAGRNHRRFYYSDIPFAYVKDTTHLNYHKSWDELIPVIKKVKGMHFDILNQTYVLDYMKAASHMNSGYLSLDIDKAHKGVYEFLLWYNQNKPNAE
jgi:hypothetical protein